MAKKPNTIDDLEAKKAKLLLAQKPVTLLPDLELELIANRYGMEYEGALKEARLLSNYPRPGKQARNRQVTVS